MPTPILNNQLISENAKTSGNNPPVRVGDIEGVGRRVVEIVHVSRSRRVERIQDARRLLSRTLCEQSVETVIHARTN